MRSENIHQFCDNRKKICSMNEMLQTQGPLSKHLARLLSSLLFVFFVLAVKGPAWSSTAVALSARFFFFSLHLPVPLLLPAFLPRPQPLDRISRRLPLFASLGRSSSLASSLSSSSSRETNTERLSRIDVITYGNFQGRGRGDV